MNKAVHAIAVAIAIGVSAWLNVADAAPEGRWLATKEHGGIAYFLSGAPAEIVRFDIATEQFLPTILLVHPPTAFFVDDDGIFVASSSSLNRLDLDGANPTALTTVAGTVREIVTFGSSIYASVQANPNFVRVDKSSGATLESKNYFYSLTGLSVSTARMKIFGRSTGVSPADIFSVELGADGTLGGLVDSPYHGDYPSGSETFVFPNETAVVDNAGIVYSTSDFSYQGSLSGSFSDVAFGNGEVLVLRDSDILRFSAGLLLTGSITVSDSPHTVYASSTRVVAFFNDGVGDLQAVSYPISSIVPPSPGEPVDPNGLVYVPDSALAAIDGTILLLSKANKSIFRWSNDTRSYTQSIPLAESPKFMAYSTVNDRIYLAYDNGRITQVSVSNGEETPFANLPSNALGLSMADPYVFAVDPAGAWVSHFTFDNMGQLISQVEWNYTSQEFVWNAVNQKMYFFRDGTSPNDLIWEDIDANGVIGAKMDSPFHGGIGTIRPIRVAANGSFVILGSGEIFNALTLDRLNSIANPIIDANWIDDGSILTVRNGSGDLVLQEWSRTLMLDDEFALATTFAKIVPIGSSTHVVWQRNGVPVFFEWFADGDDIDGDGVPDAMDVFPADPDESADNDGDGIGNNADPDDDNDGEPDTSDAFPFDPNETKDFDNDGIGDNADPDDDNDGEPDLTDAFPFDPAETMDSDNDSVGDNADAFPNDPTETTDTDDDGTGNNADDDDDGDGEPDVTDAFPLDASESNDNDNDGVGDNADIDDDNDGADDVSDAFPNDPAETTDTDNDGIGNNADDDDDGDGTPDVTDAFPQDGSESGDNDRDGVGDNADTDDDNDLMSDEWENRYGFDPFNADDAAEDIDNDGVSNLAEFQAGTDPTQAPPPQPPVPPPASGGGGGSLGGFGLILVLVLAARRRKIVASDSYQTE